jgi:hypothetical protein
MSSFLDNLKKRSSEKLKLKVIVTDAETRNTRLTICQQCENFIKVTAQCSKCGCFLTAKTWLSGSSCPVNKW